MANVLIDFPEALLERIENLLTLINGPAQAGSNKTTLTRPERDEAATLSFTLGPDVAKLWVSSRLHQGKLKLSRRALMLRLISIGMEHIDTKQQSIQENALPEKVAKLIEANQKKRGVMFE